MKAAKVKHFIYISSSSVYPPNGTLHTEDEAVNFESLSNYGVSKRTAEQWLLSEKRFERLSILRPRAIYGLGDRVLVPRLIRLKKGKFILIPGGLPYPVSLTHIDNLLEATLRLMEKQTEDMAIYNVCDNESYILGEVIENVIRSLYPTTKLSAIQPPIAILKSLSRIINIKGLNDNAFRHFLCEHEVSNAKFRKEMQYDFPQNLAHYLEALKKQVEEHGNAMYLKDVELVAWKGI